MMTSISLFAVGLMIITLSLYTSIVVDNTVHLFRHFNHHGTFFCKNFRWGYFMTTSLWSGFVIIHNLYSVSPFQENLSSNLLLTDVLGQMFNMSTFFVINSYGGWHPFDKSSRSHGSNI